MPTTAVCSRPTAAPSSAADGTSINLTRRAFSSGTILSKLFVDASDATTANASLLAFADSRTCSTPITAPRLRTPKPRSRKTRCRTAASSIITPRCRPLHRVVTATVFGRQLVDQRHDAIRFLRSDPGELEEILTLEIDDVVQRPVARVLEHGDGGRRHAADVRQTNVSHLLGLFGQRREDLRLAATLHPLATRVEIDLPAGELRGETHVLPVAADGQRELVFVDDGLDGLRSRIAEHARDLCRRQRELREPLRVGRPRYDVDALAV